MTLTLVRSRYRLYYRWKMQDRYPELNLVRAVTLNEIKKILRYVPRLISTTLININNIPFVRRLTAESVKVTGRQMGRFALHNPLTVFELILSQIQAYVNLIQPMADSLKFLTPLASDVLSCA